MSRLVVLHSDGKYTVKIGTSSQYKSILGCKETTPLIQREDKETFCNNVSNVSGYMGEDAARSSKKISEWAEFLNAIGLMDEKVGCLFGDIILTADTVNDDVPPEMLDLVKSYHKVASSGNVHKKWAHIKELTIEYSRLKKCQWKECETVTCDQHCDKCKSVMYCSNECRVKDWSAHKDDCESITDDACKQQ